MDDLVVGWRGKGRKLYKSERHRLSKAWERGLSGPELADSIEKERCRNSLNDWFGWIIKKTVRELLSAPPSHQMPLHAA